MAITFFSGAEQTHKVESSTVEIQRTSIANLFVKLLSISLKALKYLQDQMTEKRRLAP